MLTARASFLLVGILSFNDNFSKSRYTLDAVFYCFSSYPWWQNTCYRKWHDEVLLGKMTILILYGVKQMWHVNLLHFQGICGFLVMKFYQMYVEYLFIFLHLNTYYYFKHYKKKLFRAKWLDRYLDRQDITIGAFIAPFTSFFYKSLLWLTKTY